MKFGIGQPMRRHEDLRLSPGEAYGHPFNTPSLPSKSAVIPSAMLDPAGYGYGHISGMKYFTEPSLALPIRIPRCAPGLNA
jgi:hypothetical protein